MYANHIKKFLPLLTAISEGKQIQYDDKGNWVDVKEGIDWYFDEGDKPSMWRIKPESQLVPFTFEDAEFLIGKVLKMKNGTTKSPAFTLVISAGDRGVALGGSSDAAIPYDALLLGCTFLDGTPCGKLVETSNT